MFSAEESFERGNIVVVMIMSEFELMDVSDSRKILFIDVLLLLEFAHASEDAFIWFIYFHL
jgi:hypothetical protein